jgi:hypothetical protein
MAAFSVALSSLCVSTMTGMVLAPPAAPEGAVVAVPPEVPDQDVTPDMPPAFLSGFRVEGSPELDVVFGDSENYKRHIDRFFALDKAMDAARSDFSRNVELALGALAEHKKGACPADQIALPYYGAKRDGDTYRALGAELEGEEAVISQLDDLGETTALTPDYRWKAKQAPDRYKRALTDLKEMRVEFMAQLGAELGHRGCRSGDLLKRGAALVASGAPEPASAPNPMLTPPQPRPVKPSDQPQTVAATTITFYVDNQACPGAQQVFLDGALLGEVGAHGKTAFQALAGHHDLCLIDADSEARCGDPGTLRSAFLHDGWSVALHCR